MTHLLPDAVDRVRASTPGVGHALFPCFAIPSRDSLLEAGIGRSRGCLTRVGMLHMMFKLGQCAQRNWRRLRGFDDLPKVINGVKFNDGIEVTHVDQTAA